MRQESDTIKRLAPAEATEAPLGVAPFETDFPPHKRPTWRARWIP
jgi:hypothetical protein